jgi:hypothetical protein
MAYLCLPNFKDIKQPMNSRTIFLLTLLTAQILSSCNSGDASKANSTPPSATPVSSGKSAAKPETTLYMSTVDNLLLRDKPSQTGSTVLGKFKLGGFITGTGEISSTKEEATIRNVTMMEPFCEVVSTTPEQLKGWAYRGALLQVYAGSKADSPDLGKLVQFANYLTPLGVQSPENGKKAWDYVKTNFADAKGSLADAAYYILEYYLRRIETENELYTQTEQIDWKQEDFEAIDKHTFDVNKYPLVKQLVDDGFAMVTGEGMVFPSVDDQRLSDFFSSKATPALQAYLAQNLLEFKIKAYEDGGIIIPYVQIADRAAFWEKFNRENPNFPLSGQTTESQRWTRLVLLNGDNNTPTYDPSTLAVDADFKKAWEYTVQKYPGTDLARDVKALMDVFAAEGWKRTPKVEAFQQQFDQPF